MMRNKSETGEYTTAVHPQGNIQQLSTPRGIHNSCPPPGEYTTSIPPPPEKPILSYPITAPLNQCSFNIFFPFCSHSFIFFKTYLNHRQGIPSQNTLRWMYELLWSVKYYHHRQASCDQLKLPSVNTVVYDFHLILS
jgi:hypothetical protein